MELLWVDELGIVIEADAGDAAFVHKNVLAFGVGVVVLAVEPLRLVYDVWEHEHGLERIEHAGALEIVKRAAAEPAAVNVREVFAGAALGDNARHEVADLAADDDGLDGRKFFAAGGADVGMADLQVAPDADLALFLGRGDGFLPRGLRVGLLGGACRRSD